MLRKGKQITPRVPLIFEGAIRRVFSVDFLIFAKTLDSLRLLSMIYRRRGGHARGPGLTRRLTQNRAFKRDRRATSYCVAGPRFRGEAVARPFGRGAALACKGGCNG